MPEAKACVKRPCGVREIGADKGYTEVFTDSDGARHGLDLGALLTAKSDANNVLYQGRQTLAALADKHLVKGRYRKYERIVQQNLSRQKIVRQKARHGPKFAPKWLPPRMPSRFALRRKTRQDRMHRTLQAVKEQMHKRMHHSIPEQGRWLGQVVRGYFAYHAVPTNTRAIAAFRWDVTRIWRQALKRQSQKGYSTWNRIDALVQQWLPPPRVLHPWPTQRFIVNHSR